MDAIAIALQGGRKMRLIDADVLVERWKRIASISWNETAVTSWSHAYEEIISEIEDEPTIEAESVRHGEWIDTGIEELDLIYSGYKCSYCGFILCGNHTKYCPGCGAKMDKKSPENHKKYQEEETNKKSFK